MTTRRYGWIIAVCAFFTLLLSNGMTFVSLTVFDETLLSAFGWSRSTLKLRDLITFGVSSLLAPFAGALLDRVGVKPLITVGMGMLSLGMFLYSRITSAAEMYFVHFIFGIALSTAGIVVCVPLVSRWFEGHRGTAVGFALVGTSLGNSLFPLLNRILLAEVGWRNAFLYLSALPLLALPVLAWSIREFPPAREVNTRNHGGPVSLPGLDYRTAIQTKAFWAIACAAMATFFCMMGVSSHLFLYLRGEGFDPSSGANMVSLLFLMGLFGKFLFGLLSDHWDTKRVFQLNLLTMLSGMGVLLAFGSKALWPFLVLFGIGWGGLFTMLQLLAIELFGLRAAGKILGTITILDAIGGGLGPWVAGHLYDRNGSYQAAFAIFFAMNLFALVASLYVRRQDKTLVESLGV